MYNFDRNSFKFLFYLKFQLWFMKKSTALSFSDFLAILGKTVHGIRILQEVRSKLAEVSCPKNSWKIQWSAAFTSRIVLTLLNCRGRCMGLFHFFQECDQTAKLFKHFCSHMYRILAIETIDFNYCAFNIGISFFSFSESCIFQSSADFSMHLSVRVHMVIQFWITDLHN